jgi:hypothetical protein
MPGCDPIGFQHRDIEIYEHKTLADCFTRAMLLAEEDIYMD